MALIGYARVSKEDQVTDAQLDDLRAAGCARIYEDFASGADRSRPQLARCLFSLRKGDTLIIHRLDRLARSVLHLTMIAEDLEQRGIGFRSLNNDFDTTTAQGKMIYQILGTIAEFERSLIRERTRSGLRAAIARGAKPGNPGLIAGDPVALGRIADARREANLEAARNAAEPWIAIVRRHRPAETWERVLRLINETIYRDQRRLRLQTMLRHVHHLVGAGDLPRSVLDVSRRRTNSDAAAVARMIAKADPDKSLRAIAEELGHLGITPVRAGAWSAQTVKRLLDDPIEDDGQEDTDKGENE